VFLVLFYMYYSDQVDLDFWKSKFVRIVPIAHFYFSYSYLLRNVPVPSFGYPPPAFDISGLFVSTTRQRLIENLCLTLADFSLFSFPHFFHDV